MFSYSSIENSPKLCLNLNILLPKLFSYFPKTTRFLNTKHSLIMQRIPSLYVTQSNIEGRGVFTSSDIGEDTLLEICPVIIIPEKDLNTIHNTCLHDYYYYWGEEEKEGCIVLGFGSMYNHSKTPNAHCVADYENKSFNYYTLREIEAGEEITVNYNGDSGKNTVLWFEEKE